MQGESLPSEHARICQSQWLLAALNSSPETRTDSGTNTSVWCTVYNFLAALCPETGEFHWNLHTWFSLKGITQTHRTRIKNNTEQTLNAVLVIYTCTACKASKLSATQTYYTRVWLSAHTLGRSINTQRN